MGLFELLNRASAVTMSAISVGMVLHIILPKNDAYYGFDIGMNSGLAEEGVR
jgi:hypothetical protein